MQHHTSWDAIVRSSSCCHVCQLLVNSVGEPSPAVLQEVQEAGIWFDVKWSKRDRNMTTIFNFSIPLSNSTRMFGKPLAVGLVDVDGKLILLLAVLRSILTRKNGDRPCLY